MFIIPLTGLKSWVLIPLRVFRAKYLNLHKTHYFLGVPQSIEWLFTYISSLQLCVVFVLNRPPETKHIFICLSLCNNYTLFLIGIFKDKSV